MRLVRHCSDDPERPTAATTQCPEEIGIPVFVGIDEGSLRSYDRKLNDIVDGWKTCSEQVY